MDIKIIHEKLHNAISLAGTDEVADKTPSWVKNSLVGAGLSLALLGCSSTPRQNTQQNATPAYAGPPSATMKKSMLPPDVDIYGAPPTDSMSPTTMKPNTKPVTDVVAEYAVAEP